MHAGVVQRVGDVVPRTSPCTLALAYVQVTLSAVNNGFCLYTRIILPDVINVCYRSLSVALAHVPISNMGPNRSKWFFHGKTSSEWTRSIDACLSLTSSLNSVERLGKMSVGDPWETYNVDDDTMTSRAHSPCPGISCR